MHSFRTDVLPANFSARMGLFSFDAGSSITSGTGYYSYADKVGTGAGRGFTHNLPLPRGADFAQWRAALTLALQGIAKFGAQALIVSLGLDTFEGDPISGFKLCSDNYLRVGEDIARAGLPTVFVFEGGYAVAELG